MQYTGLNWDQLSFPETFFLIGYNILKKCVCVCIFTTDGSK